MNNNVGSGDMFWRLIIGIGFLIIGFLDTPLMTPGIPKKIIAAMGVIVTISALIRNCPLYYLAGINTSKKEQE